MRDALGAVQSILVLGATSEIAQATVRRLVGPRTTRVVLAARDTDAAEPFAAEVRRTCDTVEVVAFDASEPASHQAVIDAVFAGGDIDLVLVAFGVLGDQSSFDADPATAAAAVSVNYVGGVSSCLAVAAAMRRQGHGAIVVLSSVAGVRARADNYVYGSSKAGLDAFAHGLGDALVDHGVHVMVVRPGFVHTRMTAGMSPAPFSIGPDAVAEAIAAGLAKRRDVVWAPPVLRVLFLVLRHLPRPLWRKVSAR